VLRRRQRRQPLDGQFPIAIEFAPERVNDFA